MLAARWRPVAVADGRGDGRRRFAVIAQLIPDAGVFALVGGDGRDLGRTALGVVRLFLVALEGLDEIRDGLGAEEARHEDDEPDAGSRRPRRRHVDAELRQLGGPDVGMAPLVGGDPLERAGPTRVPFDRRQRVVQDDRVAFELQVLQAGLDIDRRHVAMVAPRIGTGPRASSAPRRLGGHGARPRCPVALPLVRRCRGRDAAARRAPGARGTDDDGPRLRRAPNCRPRSGSTRVRTARSRTRCRPTCAARPTRTGRTTCSGSSGSPGSRGNEARGLPAISALVVLSDPTTGQPVAILDGGAITAQRTAAVTGVAVRRFAPAVHGRAARVTLIGAGVQGRSHLPVLGAVLPGLELAIHDRHADRADALA